MTLRPLPDAPLSLSLAAPLEEKASILARLAAIPAESEELCTSTSRARPDAAAQEAGPILASKALMSRVVPSLEEAVAVPIAAKSLATPPEEDVQSLRRLLRILTRIDCPRGTLVALETLYDGEWMCQLDLARVGRDHPLTECTLRL